MKQQIISIALILFGQVLLGQTNCEMAEQLAIKDFKEEKYMFHSLPFSPVESIYLYVLRENYGIQWRFTDQDSLEYYNCYDSTLTTLLKDKFGSEFLDKAKTTADSLEKTENWRKDPEYPGGKSAMYQFIWERLTIKSGDIKDRSATPSYPRFRTRMKVIGDCIANTTNVDLRLSCVTDAGSVSPRLRRGLFV